MYKAIMKWLDDRSFNWWFLGFGGLLTLILMFLTDPDVYAISQLPYGGSTLATLLIMSRSILYVGMFKLFIQTFVSEEGFPLKQFVNKAKEDSIASGLALIALSLFSIAVAIVIFIATIK